MKVRREDMEKVKGTELDTAGIKVDVTAPYLSVGIIAER